MRRRVVQLGSVLVAVVALAVVLWNATLVDRRPPGIARIALSATVGGDDHRAQTLTAIDVDFSEPVRHATAERRFSLQPYVAGTFSWDGPTMIFTPSDKLPADTAFTVTVAPGVEDLAGNVAPTGSDPWQFRTLGPPTVETADPADGATNVPVDPTVRVAFDRLMDTQAVEEAITVRPDAAWHATWSGRVLAISFDAPLSYGTDYTVSIGTGAADTDGSALRADWSLHFSTVAAGLGVTATLPAPNTSGVNVRTPIAVMFDAPVDPTSIAGALRITPAIGGDLRLVSRRDDRAAAASPSPPPSASPTGSAPPAADVLVFTPSGPLAAHTTFTVTLQGVVRAADGSGVIAAGRTWSFTTGGPSQSAQNQIAFLSSRGGVRNVWLMNPDGSNQRELTSELVPVTSYDVASSGDLFAYAAGGVVTVSSIDGTQVTALTTDGRFEYSPTIGPEGRSVILARRDASGADLGWWLVPLPGGTEVERQLLATGAPPLGSVELTGDGLGDLLSGPSWTRRAAVSEDGRSALVAAADGKLELVDLAPSAPTSPREIDLRPVSAPTWNATRSAFVLVATRSGETSGVWAVGADGSTTRLADGASSAAIGPNGGIATVSAGTPGHLSFVAPGASVSHELTTAADLADRMPSFGPDGHTILFLRVSSADPTRSAGIWTVDPDGRELRQLSTDGAAPRWLP